jgi:hypothetical protein
VQPVHRGVGREPFERAAEPMADSLVTKWQKQSIMVAVLALRLGLVASTDVFIEAGWGDDRLDPETATTDAVERVSVRTRTQHCGLTARQDPGGRPA